METLAYNPEQIQEGIVSIFFANANLNERALAEQSKEIYRKAIAFFEEKNLAVNIQNLATYKNEISVFVPKNKETISQNTETTTCEKPKSKVYQILGIVFLSVLGCAMVLGVVWFSYHREK